MSTPKNKPRAKGIFDAPDPNLLRFTIGVNRIAANHEDVDAYFLRNQVLLEEEKARIREENGFAARLPVAVIPPSPTASRPAAQEVETSAESKPDLQVRPKPVKYDAQGKTSTAPTSYTHDQLKTDGDRFANHRRTLSRNLNKAGFARPADVCAHHIVASGEPDAKPSREVIYAWGIGVNDADNGVFLPRFKNVAVPSLPSAIHHGTLHSSAVYCARVHRRLTNVDAASQEAGRRALRRMRDEMVQGVFPYQ